MNALAPDLTAWAAKQQQCTYYILINGWHFRIRRYAVVVLAATDSVPALSGLAVMIIFVIQREEIRYCSMLICFAAVANTSCQNHLPAIPATAVR